MDCSDSRPGGGGVGMRDKWGSSPSGQADCVYEYVSREAMAGTSSGSGAAGRVGGEFLEEVVGGWWLVRWW